MGHDSSNCYINFNGNISNLKMIVGSASENIEIEKRIAITPEVVKKYNSLGIKINITKNYAKHLGISDEEFKKEGQIY